MRKYLYMFVMCMTMLTWSACKNSKIDYDKCDMFITQGVDDDNIDEALEQYDALYNAIYDGIKTRRKHADEPIEKVMSEAELADFQRAQLAYIQLQAAMLRAPLNKENGEKAYSRILETEKSLSSPEGSGEDS